MTTRHGITSELASIERSRLANTTGGSRWNPVKNALKTAANAAVNYENAVLPDQIQLGDKGGSATWNIGKIPKPFHDDPWGKYRHEVFKGQ